MTVALLDADIICYRASVVSQVELDWGEGDGTELMVNKKAARQIALDIVDEWTKAAKCKRQLLVFSDRSAPKRSFRYKVHPEYKANRTNEKPVLHDDITLFLKDHFRYVEFPGLEGDDALGLMATGPDGAKYVVVSIDKDMLTLPVRQVNPDDDDPKPHKVTQMAADYAWMHQTITGDPVDNYKGAPGAGKVAANRALAMAKNVPAMWAEVLMVYADQFDHKRWGESFVTDSAWSEALMNARCARILRYGDYDPKKRMVRLWHPEARGVEWINPIMEDVDGS